MLLTLSPAVAALCLALGYLLGSIPFGLLLTRAAGTADLRGLGSAISARPTCCAPAARTSRR